ncbi:MAG: nucleotidyl cyclase domain-containing protein, partial [Myxococcaceae bacterium]
MSGARGREETPTLAALMLSSLLPSAEAAIRGAALPAPADRVLRGAAGVGMFLALRLGAERALREAKSPAELAMRIEAPLSVLPLLGGRPALAGCGATFWGAELTAGLPLADETLQRLSAGADPGSAQGAIAKAIASDEGLARLAEREAAVGHLRERFARVAVLGEQHLLAPALTEQTRALASHPGQLAALLADDKARKELGKDLGRMAEGQASTVHMALGELGAVLKAYKEKDPAACAGLKREQAHAAYAGAVFAATCDLWLDRALLPSRRALEARTGAESEGGLDGEYAAGRLYRLSAAEGPLLKSTASAPVAHLFVDVKDFTRRTSLLGQAAIAEFLRREFYVPILSSAKAHFGGMAHLSDRGGVSVNNLLGDALSVSGGIESLGGLALEIRRHLASYERQLARSVSGEQVARAVQSIEEEYARRSGAARPGTSPAQLEADRQAALARARGEGLEAGVFVSFGPAPLVVTIDDEIFGRQRVAIADRINESARGTARAGGARARADALLAAERVRRGEAGLSHPWAVFVGAP